MARTTKEHGPHPVDVHVGKQLRLRRTALGMSQERLGEGLDLTFQQVQKYERGSNRISASKLYDVAKILDVPVSWFFAGLDDGKKHDEGDLLITREAAELIQAYHRIKRPDVRRNLRALTKSLGKE